MAILNLAVNARDAMPDGGTLRVSVDLETVGRQHRSGLKPGRYLCLSVADTGTGMDEATLARAIEPFFSTKGVGKGTGLGLSMAHGLVSNSAAPSPSAAHWAWGPTSSCSSSGQEAGTAGRGNCRSRTSRCGEGTVLLVDDEELVRLSTADMLIELGYAVVEAASADEALRLLISWSGPGCCRHGSPDARHVRDGVSAALRGRATVNQGAGGFRLCGVSWDRAGLAPTHKTVSHHRTCGEFGNVGRQRLRNGPLLTSRCVGASPERGNDDRNQPKGGHHHQERARC